MKKIAIFGSGSGTNAENIIRYFKDNVHVSICLLVTNTDKSRFKVIAEENSIPFKLISNTDFAENKDLLIQTMNEFEVDWIILAGFLRKIHSCLISSFPNKIINIHPSLLPKYGGKGMYGMKVHEAVFKNQEAVSGITVHFVNENFDEGEIIAQKEVKARDCKSPEEIRERVQKLEQKYFPEIINATI